MQKNNTHNNYNQYLRITMSFKANVDIAISFTYLKMCSIRQQGLLKFRICLFHCDHSKQQKNPTYIFCHPYSIMRQQKEKKSSGLTVVSNQQNKIPQQNKNIHMSMQSIQQQPTQNKEKQYFVFKPSFHKIPTSSRLPPHTQDPISTKNESQLDLESQFYYSKTFQVLHEKQTHSIMETCCFRTYVDTDNFQDLELKCLVQVLFSSEANIQSNNNFKTIARCQCKIRKIFDISTYFPIVFDQFDGVTLDGIYQASLMDFRFQKSEDDHYTTVKSANFYEYLKQATNSFKRYETHQFYRFYRGILEKQLLKIQERHYDLLRVLELLKSEVDFRRIRMNPNGTLIKMIENLETNSHIHGLHQYGKKTTNSIVESSRNGIYYNKNSELRMSTLSSRSFTGFSSQLQAKVSYEEELCQEILKDLLAVKAQIFQKWIEFLQFTQQNITPITQRYKKTYYTLVKERLSSNVFSHRVTNVDWKISAYEDSGKEHLKQAQLDKKKFQKDQQLWKQTFPVDNEAYFTKDSKTIKIFQEIYEVNKEKLKAKKSTSRNSYEPHPLHQNALYYKKEQQKSDKRKNSLREESFETFMTGNSFSSQKEDHYIVLVHGYQASRQDFLLFKNCLQIKYKVKVYISTCNEGRTEEPIEIMGKRLAVELQSFLNRSQRSMNYKLSFIGHSMGGIIIRTALCYLQNIDRHLHTFISFSTPHLGYLYNQSTHIQAGLWFMNTWQKSDSIEQLCMRDNDENRNCFLYKLSKTGSLNNFKNVAFIGSCQDKYVPYQSARIEQNQTIISEKLGFQEGQILREMIEGILQNMKCKQFSRMDIVFNIEDSNFDTMIGRTGHVKFLSDKQFIKIFCTVFDKYFR